MRDLVPFVNDMKRHLIGFDNFFDDIVHLPRFIEDYPKDNVINLGNTVVIELALAGFDKDDITITREGNELVVEGKKEKKEEIEEENYVRKNIASRAFTKRYTVAKDYKDVVAKFQNGILSISMERIPIEEDTKKLIDIN